MTPLPIRPIRPPDWLVRAAGEVAGVSVAMVRSGVLRSTKPSQLLPIERALRRWGLSMAGLAAVAAIRHPDRPAVIDELGTITYGQLDRRVTAQAAGLAATYGLVAESKVMVRCRNHRGFLEAGMAAARLGADVQFLDSELPRDQLADLVARHRPALLVVDEEFAADARRLGCPIVLAWQEGDSGDDSLDRLAAGDWPEPPAPRSSSVADAPTAAGLTSLAATVVNRTGLRAEEPMVICPPLSDGSARQHAMLAMLLGSPLVLARRYDARSTLASVDLHRAGSVLVVPELVQQLVDLGPAELSRYDLSSLRAVISRGAPLRPGLGEQFVARFGARLDDHGRLFLATVAPTA